MVSSRIQTLSLGSYLVAIEVLFQPPLSKSLLLSNGQEPAVLLNFDDVAIICEQLEMSLFVLAPWHWYIVDAIGTSATLLAHFQRQQVLLIKLIIHRDACRKPTLRANPLHPHTTYHIIHSSQLRHTQFGLRKTTH